MQAIRYPITEWQKIGLRKASYVVIDQPYQLEKRLADLKYVGHLTAKDIKGLKEFILNYQNQ